MGQGAHPTTGASNNRFKCADARLLRGGRRIKDIWTGQRLSPDVVIAGVLTWATGLVAIAFALVNIANDSLPSGSGSNPPLAGLGLGWLASTVGGPLACLAGAFTLKQRHFAFSLISTVFGSMGAFFVAGYPGGLLGAAAVFFVVISKPEFFD